MKRIVTLCLLFLYFAPPAFAQDSLPKKHYMRPIIWTAPVARNTTINGNALSLITLPWKKADTLQVNGLNLEFNPLTTFASIYAVMGVVLSPFGNKKKVEPFGEMGSPHVFPNDSSGHGAIVRGISLSGGGLMANLDGIGVNGLVSMAPHVRGLEISGIMNLHYDFRGVIIAGLRNKTTTGKGLQIGLINVSKGGQLVQLGLFNRIGKRITPIVNFSFKKQNPPPPVALTTFPLLQKTL
ncbi:hypothetical protein [Chitinophaga arvensicola]|uniref:Uncharacterized protein n=1 Tax=Chitinophaga arvensicola TaxID=29529 RepID=A0A1I0S7X9_9BACT|nr:hypothetical protein [Chitinophaga arvensicola]SEW51945.1 hypothetical protein SAMN04488122_4604 [Chitinophaga arvensicola]